MFTLTLGCFRFIRDQVSLDHIPVGVVIRHRRMDLGQGKMTNPIRNLLRQKPEFVPGSDTPHRYSSTSDPRTATANAVSVSNQTANLYFGLGAHLTSMMGFPIFVKSSTVLPLTAHSA
jgi:hypothetical protein